MRPRPIKRDDPRSLREDAATWQLRAELRDGTPVLLRPIQPEDRDRLAEGVRQLSDDAKRQRFHAPIAGLTDAQLDYLTEIDHVDHEAVGALDLDHLERPGIGVARYLRDPYQPEAAEVAITVADAYQGRGAGTLLLGALASRARRHGVEVLRHYVAEDNQAMLAVLDGLGAERAVERPGLWRVDLPVRALDEPLPGSPAWRSFGSAARARWGPVGWLRARWGRLRSRRARSAAADASIAEGLATLSDELDTWLADRDHRSPGWPGSGAD